VGATGSRSLWRDGEHWPAKRGLLVVLSGPSAAGKDAVLSELGATAADFTRIVTLTTRPRRPVETSGIDYHFVSKDQFEQLRDSGQLLEWADVYGKLYGTPLQATRDALERGETVILKIDVQGAAQIRQRAADAVFIFLGPGSFDELVERLRARGTESLDVLQRRIEQAREELAQFPTFDYLVVNRQGELAVAVEQVRAIILAERLRVHPRNARLP
jgi:guanylate kinase